MSEYREVDWVVRCQTLVAADTDREAEKQVGELFEQRPWGHTGACVATVERMEVTKVGLAKEMQDD